MVRVSPGPMLLTLATRGCAGAQSECQRVNGEFLEMPSNL